MTERTSSWKFADWPEIEPAIQQWSSDTWGWSVEAITTALSQLEWTSRKTARDMLLFRTNLSVESEAVLRLDNVDKTLVRSLGLVITSVVTPHESNTGKAKTFLAESFALTAAALGKQLGEATSPDDVTSNVTSKWDVPAGHVVLALTARSIRLTFYSPAGLKQADAATKAKAEAAGREKKKKAPAAWRV